MNAKPDSGFGDVGGATPNPGAALTDMGAVNLRRPSWPLHASRPAEAILAALSWHANQAITRQVDVTFRLADMARAHGLAVAESLESNLPEGSLREALSAATRGYIECAESAARAATRFGRHFGHLAFAFPRPAL